MYTIFVSSDYISGCLKSALPASDCGIFFKNQNPVTSSSFLIDVIIFGILGSPYATLF
ncbi:hypothetical protein [Alysiella filiformis]|uniref:hypothetical protein n=1 Tax=Alysiella filiformis TaxID=194196 RepID=UPI0015C95BD3|nr:hypothetical protein [Alysiella filiformis]QMT30792.1 hypothetical protein H3L97_08580 [Alysiella filiformis]UBQ56226.1 hypothetical protein JF568_00105 [Alysiella filiformis DSM 16848]